MFKDLGDWGNIQVIKVEIDSLKKIQTETELEMKNVGCQIKPSEEPPKQLTGHGREDFRFEGG